jgi:hypothetical protein
MRNNGLGLLDRLEYGLFGDVCKGLVAEARAGLDSNPGSFYSYAVWQACKELARHFEDEQGIPVEKAAIINQLTLEPLKHLVTERGLEGETKGSAEALAELLKGLHELRRGLRTTHLESK